MQPSRPDTPDAISDFVDGRTTLRLVKIRLALTLIAVAILPLAVLAPVARSVLGDPRPAQQERLAGQAERISVEVQREIEVIRGAMRAAAGSEQVVGALAKKPAEKTINQATDALQGLLDEGASLITAAAIVDASGAIRASAGGDATSLLSLGIPAPGDPGVRPVPGPDGGLVDLEIALPIAGAPPADASGAPTIGTILASVPIDGLLRWANAGLPSAAESLQFVDPDRQFGAAEVADLIADPVDVGSLIEIKTDPNALARGVATMTTPGLVGWMVIASAPQSIMEIPLAVVAALVVMILLLLWFTVWMSRQILAPAAAMEEQRAQFHALYMTAREAALQDSLTGLGNHRAFQETLTRMVERARRHGHRFALVLLDIDEFKSVNDSRGHAVGDELLMEVGTLIRGAIRGADVGFRIGGDEFALLLAEADVEGALVVARRILTRGLEGRVSGHYREPISFSAGLTACPEGGMDRLELTAQADAALYRGKREGRTIVNAYDPEIDRRHVDGSMRAELSASIGKVIESRGLTAVYQPIVHLDTGRILGYEGLVRVDPASGFPHTGALFDAAEIAGRVLDLDRAALDVVLRGITQVPADALLSVNVSPRSFETPEFSAASFLGILRRHDVEPRRILMELTERDAVKDPDRLRATIETLRAAGVRIAADDVGAGNAGLRLLSQFKFDVVKIDLSLVQGADRSQTMSVLKSLIELAGRSGSLTIAEGVETAAQLEMIRQLDVDAAQGYLLGRPGAITDSAPLDLDALAASQSVRGTVAVAPGVIPAVTPDPGAVRVRTSRSAPIGIMSSEPLTAAAIIANGAPSSFADR
ncbi:MAG: EAL domain-containing protein [Chloroflexota bacterium]